MEKNNKLPLRIGVGIVLLNNNNEVFVGKRIDNPIDLWQMPQGGVDENEQMIHAAKRELEEETGITKTKLIKELDYWLEYELPKNLIKKIWQGRYRGQKQKWFIMKFIGQAKDINIKTKRPEFLSWKWVNYYKLPDVVVSFKVNIYKKIVKEIELLNL